MRPLDIRHITVRKGALDMEVAAAVETFRVEKYVAQRVLRELPNLKNHVCVNGNGRSFGEELVGTELPHLLEHVVIELQGYGTGHTSWIAGLDETHPQGYALMRVTVSFRNDFMALRAVEQARRLIERAVLDQ